MNRWSVGKKREITVNGIPWAHNPKVVGSNPAPATNKNKGLRKVRSPLFLVKLAYPTLYPTRKDDFGCFEI